MEVNVLGAGVMGQQISATLLLLGCDVSLWSPRLAEATESRVRSHMKLSQRVWPELKGDRTGCLRLVASLSDLRDCPTVESVVESLDVKRQVFAALASVVGPQSYFTNASSIAPREIGDAVSGLHFFNPVCKLRLIEVCQGGGGLSEPARHLLDRLESAGFQVVHVKPNRGYVGNFVLFRLISAVCELRERYGYSEQAIEQVLQAIGAPVNVPQVIDTIGVDVCDAIFTHLAEEQKGLYVPVALNAALSKNVYGKKTSTSIKSVM
jgi:3-hydroxyacyl-CoA dehydrogenase